jgi:uncharacterized protein (TIGR03437 family)
LYLLSSGIFFLNATHAQTSTSNGQCQATSTPAQVRAEGITERVGDIALLCSGGAAGAALSANLTVFLPVSITNRVDSSNLTHDVSLALDLGGGFVPTGAAGLISANSVAFNGISLTIPAGGSFGLRISGIRGNISQLGRTNTPPVSASLSSTLQVNQANLVVGVSQPGLLATLESTGITCYGTPSPSTFTMSGFFSAGTAFASTRLTEGFASAFEVRSSGTDSGTRFLIKYTGFPSNARLFVPDFVAGSDATTPTAGGDLGVPQNGGVYTPGNHSLLLARVATPDSNGAAGFSPGAPSGGPVTFDSVSEVVLSGGAGSAVYEVVDSNSVVQESAQFPTFIVMPKQSATSVAQETVSLAPVSTVLTASQSAPVPRFAPGPVATDCNALNDCGAPYFPNLMVDSAPITMSAVEKGGALTSPPGYIRIRNGGGGVLNWNVAISYIDGGTGWLFQDASAGQGATTVGIWPDTRTLSAGTYHATVQVNAGGAGSQAIPLTLTVAALPPAPPVVVTPPVVTPVVTISKVVNAATFSVTPLVAGSLGTLMGSHFSGKSVSVTFDGTAARILYSSDTQINLQTPSTLAGKTSANVVVTVDGVASAPFPVTLAASWPAIFAHGVLNQNNSENTAASSAQAGSILQIFATGIAKDATVSVQYGAHKDLVPVYAGDAPDVPGVQQVNVALPTDAVSGDLVICATASGQQYCSTGYAIVLK